MDGIKLDGNLAKRLAGGGDELTIRQNFRDECKVNLMTTFMAMANDMPEFTPIDDALRVRMKYIQSDHTFVPKPAEECTGIEKPADPLLKEKVASVEWQDAFAHAIFDAYGDGSVPIVPAEVVASTDDYVPPPSVGLGTALEDAGYTLDPTASHFVPSRTLIASLRSAGLSSLSDAKIARELAKLPGLKRHETRVAGKVTRGWLGIKPS